MHQEFERFSAAWRQVMNARGGISMPARRDLKTQDFAPFVPSMMITCWDFDVPQSTALYGRQVDALFSPELKAMGFAGLFSDADQHDRYIEMMRHVSTELIGGHLLVEISLAGKGEEGSKILIEQFSLPLAPEKGLPVVANLFRWDPLSVKDLTLERANEHSDTKIVSTRYVDLFD